MIINSPDLWLDSFPLKNDKNHKYDAGSAIVYAAPEMTGATRLAATACARVGAGLVNVLCTNETYDIFRTSLPAHIITRKDLHYKYDKVSARLYGCGGLSREVDFKSDIPTVLDAEALRILPNKLMPNYILTPHEGEFAKAFPEINGSKAEMAIKAAKEINAIIVLKGRETIIAAPSGEIITNDHASPYLATAGTGDVLAGMITGLIAQKMPPFHAACAAVWIHGEAGLVLGPGLVASDIETILPTILKNLFNKGKSKTMGFLS